VGSIRFLTLIHIAHQLWITWTCAEQNYIRPPSFSVDRLQHCFTTIRPVLRDVTYENSPVCSPLWMHFIYATMLRNTSLQYVQFSHSAQLRCKVTKLQGTRLSYYEICVPCQQRVTFRHLSHVRAHQQHVLDKAYQFSITPVGLDISSA
jgi:hypothetical protein